MQPFVNPERKPSKTDRLSGKTEDVIFFSEALIILGCSEFSDVKFLPRPVTRGGLANKKCES